jgi:hypothetical protein
VGETKKNGMNLTKSVLHVLGFHEREPVGVRLNLARIFRQEQVWGSRNFYCYRLITDVSRETTIGRNIFQRSMVEALQLDEKMAKLYGS